MNSLFRRGTALLVITLAACGGGENADTGHYAGGTVTGLKAGNSVHLSSGQQQLTLGADGTYRFGRFPSGTAYNIAVNSTSTTQTCTIANGSGVISTEDITNIAVTCVDNFKVSGTLSGYQLANTPVRLSLNGAESLDVSANGGFVFSSFVGNGSTYSVTIASQPPELTCTVLNGSGTVAGADVSNVAVNCVVTAGTLNVLVRGLTTPDPLVLQLDGSVVGSAALASRQINAPDNGSYSFAAPVPVGSTYIVSVAQQPSSMVCSVSNGIGTFSLTGTTTVVVDCAPPLYVISGAALLVAGNQTTVSLYDQNETLIDTVTVSRAPAFGNSVPPPALIPFSFGRRFLTGFSFFADANGCSDFGFNSGTIGGADITNLDFDCTNF